LWQSIHIFYLEETMKNRKWLLVALCVVVLGFAALIACGDDDDDDDDDDAAEQCSDGCSIVYDDCDSAIYYDGVPYSKSECVESCVEDGGLEPCTAVCADNYALDKDCPELLECVIACGY
jgi:hypothetical protein